MPKITVYTKTFCPYCVQAKSLLKKRGFDFEEISVEKMDVQEWSEFCQKSGMKTVPQIFVGDRLIGGYTDLAELDQQDQLKSLR